MAPMHCLRLAGLEPVSEGKKRELAEKTSMVSAAGS